MPTLRAGLRRPPRGDEVAVREGDPRKPLAPLLACCGLALALAVPTAAPAHDAAALFGGAGGLHAWEQTQVASPQGEEAEAEDGGGGEDRTTGVLLLALGGLLAAGALGTALVRVAIARRRGGKGSAR